MPESISANAADVSVDENARSAVGHHLERQRAHQDPAGAEPVDRGAARPGDQEPDQRRQAEQQPDVPEVEVADLVQVDDVERQHQAGADELEHHHRQQQLPLAGQVVPERAEGGLGGGLRRHPDQCPKGRRQAGTRFSDAATEPTPRLRP